MTIAEASFRSLGGILSKPTALLDLSHQISDRTVDSEISVNRKVEVIALVKDILDERFNAAFINDLQRLIAVFTKTLLKEFPIELFSVIT